LPVATNAIVQGVEIGRASTLHSVDIGATGACKSAKGDGSPEAPNFGIKETIGGLGTTSVEAVTIGRHATSVGALINAAGAINGGLAITAGIGIGDEGGRSAEAP